MLDSTCQAAARAGANTLKALGCVPAYVLAAGANA